MKNAQESREFTSPLHAVLFHTIIFLTVMGTIMIAAVASADPYPITTIIAGAIIFFGLMTPVLILFALVKIQQLFMGRSGTKITPPPASFLLKIADLLPDKYATDLIQTVSDMRLEYYEAIGDKKLGRAKMLVASYYVGFGWTVLMWIVYRVKDVLKISQSSSLS